MVCMWIDFHQWFNCFKIYGSIWHIHIFLGHFGICIFAILESHYFIWIFKLMGRKLFFMILKISTLSVFILYFFILILLFLPFLTLIKILRNLSILYFFKEFDFGWILIYQFLLSIICSILLYLSVFYYFFKFLNRKLSSLIIEFTCFLICWFPLYKGH